MTLPSAPRSGTPNAEPSFLRPSLADAERRGELRSAFSLMRTAKLVCQAGEYVCLLRDISSGGVRLRMFHEVPAETHVFLELASGEVHPLIRVWASGASAGFRFVRTVDPQEFLAAAGNCLEREIRLRLSAPGTVFANGFTRPVVLRSLSQSSARIEADFYLALCQSLILSIDGVGERAGWVRWRRGRNYDITFETTVRLDQLAAEALALQPLPPHEAQTQLGAA